MPTKKTRRTCSKGHTFYKASDCPTCPICQKMQEPASGFLAKLSNPARNTLLHHGIDTIEKLASYTEKEVLSLHGVGKASLPAFHQALKENGLAFQPEKSPAK